jgi:hypothetical protein
VDWQICIVLGIVVCFTTAGCNSIPQLTSSERAIESALNAVTLILDTPAKVEFPAGRCFVRRINRPTGYAIPDDETQQYDYLVTGVVDVQNAFGVMQRRDWWVVCRHHKHGGFTNEGWGFDSPPESQAEIDARVSNW